MGISSAHLSNVLNSQRAVTWEFCEKVAQAFNTSPVTIFQKAGLLSERQELSEQIADEVAQLSEENQYIVQRIVRSLALRELVNVDQP